jgi:hypothetical protein
MRVIYFLSIYNIFGCWRNVITNTRDQLKDDRRRGIADGDRWLQFIIFLRFQIIIIALVVVKQPRLTLDKIDK